MKKFGSIYIKKEMEGPGFLKVISVSKEMPEAQEPTVAFVIGVGFMQAKYTGRIWRSMITGKKIKPTHWCKPIELYEALADHCDMKEQKYPPNTYRDEFGNLFYIAKHGFKRVEDE